MSRRAIEAGKAVIVVDLVDKTNKAMNNIQSKMMNMSRAFRDMSTNFAGGALVSGLAVKGVVGQYTKFEDQLLNLSAKLGIFGNVTAQQQAQLDDLTDTILKLGKATSYTNTEVADAAISLAQAGFSVEEIKASLKATLDLARGTGYGLGDAADLLANIVRNQDIVKATNSLVENQKAIEHTASMMVKATRLGTIEVWDLRESLKYAAGTTKNLGSDLATVLGLLVQMSETGLKASLAGTSMNVAYQNMVKNLEKAKESLPEFELYVSLDDRIDFAKTFKSLHKELSKLDAVTRTQLLGDIFNIRGARMVASIQDMEKVEKFIYEIGTAGEEAAMAAAKMESGIGGATRRLKAEFEGLNFVIGTAFNKEIKGMLNMMTVTVNSIGKFIEKNKLLSASFLSMPFVLTGMAVGSLALSFVMARLTWVVSGLTKVMNGFKKTAGVMLNSVPGTISAARSWLTTPSPEKAALQKQADKVAKLQTKINDQTARANAKKSARARAAALARIQAGATMKALQAESAKLAALQAGRPKAFAGFGGWIKDTYIKAQAARQGQVRLKAQIAAEKLNNIRLQKERDRLNNAPIALADVSKQMKAIGNSRQEIDNHQKRLALLDKTKPIVANLAKYDKKIAIYGRAIARYSNLQVNYNTKLLNSKAELARVAAEELKIEKAYDRLYKVRQMKAANPEFIKGIGGVGMQVNPIYERLAKEEAQLASYINKTYGVLAVKRKHYEKEIANYAARLTQIEAAKRGTKLRAQAMTSQKATATKLAAIQHQTTIRQAKKTSRDRINLEKGVIARNTRDMAAIQRRAGIAGMAARTAAMGRNAVQLATSGQMLKTLTAGLRSFAGLRTVFKSINFMKIIQSIVTLTLNFARLSMVVARTTFSLTRFVFSMNFVGMALNVLLLFGDKIPVVRKAFEELGAGISGAFSELGKIGTYASPAIKLIQLAMSAFTEGNSEIGFKALKEAFTGIVGIIKNQLSAAWSNFMSKIQETLTFVKQLWAMISAVVTSIGAAVSSIIGSASATLGRVISGVGGLFGGGSGNFGSTIMNILATISMTIDLFLTSLAGFIQDLTYWSDIFVNKLTQVFNDVVAKLPFVGSANRALAAEQSKAAKDTVEALQAQQKNARDQRNKGVQSRQEQIQKAFFDAMNRHNIAAQHAKDAQRFNNISANIMEGMFGSFQALQNKLNEDIKRRFQEQAALEASTSPYSTPETVPYVRPNSLNEVADAVKQFVLTAKTVSGSFHSTHGNRLLMESPKEIDLQKSMLNELKGIRSDIKTQGAF